VNTLVVTLLFSIMSKRPRTDDDPSSDHKHELEHICVHDRRFVYTTRDAVKPKCMACERDELLEIIRVAEVANSTVRQQLTRDLIESTAECKKLRAALQATKSEAAKTQPNDDMTTMR
jgi:hypothetical protein